MGTSYATKIYNISRLFVHSFANTIFTCFNFFVFPISKLKYNCALIRVLVSKFKPMPSSEYPNSMGCTEHTHTHNTCKCNTALGGFLWPVFPQSFCRLFAVYMLFRANKYLLYNFKLQGFLFRLLGNSIIIIFIKRDLHPTIRIALVWGGHSVWRPIDFTEIFILLT